MKSLKERAQDLKLEAEEKKQTEALSTWGKVKKYCKRAALVGGLAAILSSPVTGPLTLGWLSTRRDYPTRNCLFSSTHTVYIAGNKEKRAADRGDTESEIKISEGGGVESKVGTWLASTKRETRGDIEYYRMYDDQNVRIASATQKPERFQAGLRIGGSTNFREQFAEIILPGKTKASQKYMVYRISPERGFKEWDIDVVEYPEERGLGENEPGIIEERDKDGKKVKDVRVMYNRLVESRNTIGWFKGKEYRSGTLIEDFANSPENKKLAEKFFDKIRVLDSPESVDEHKRETLIKEILEIERDMQKNTTYASHEDGFFKVLPQGSTVYLGENPGDWERFKNWLCIDKGEHNRIRIDNHWDLFPGNYPLLNKISIGTGKNKSYPFDKYNNGGYTIRDKYGDIAKVEIEDFLFFYGNDVLYKYYADLNGDGKIDKEKESLGKVVCRTTHDEKTEIDNLARGIEPTTDTTFTVNYFFMAPDSDMKKGWEYFKLCAYMETMMPDIIHRGNGKDSLLLLINDQRSDIMLYKDLSVENLSRTLTQESTLVAKRDIVRVLNATKRPYARDVAKKYGIEQEFIGYQDSQLVGERWDFGPWPEILLTIGAVSGLYYLNKRRKQRKAAEIDGERKKYGLDKLELIK